MAGTHFRRSRPSVVDTAMLDTAARERSRQTVRNRSGLGRMSRRFDESRRTLDILQQAMQDGARRSPDRPGHVTLAGQLDREADKRQGAGTAAVALLSRLLVRAAGHIIVPGHPRHGILLHVRRKRHCSYSSTDVRRAEHDPEQSQQQQESSERNCEHSRRMTRGDIRGKPVAIVATDSRKHRTFNNEGNEQRSLSHADGRLMSDKPR